MKVNKDLVLRKLGKKYVVIATGELSNKFHGMIRLNETGASMFNLLKEETTKEELLDNLLKEYKVDRSILVHDVDLLINTLESNGLLDE